MSPEANESHVVRKCDISDNVTVTEAGEDGNKERGSKSAVNLT